MAHTARDLATALVRDMDRVLVQPPVMAPDRATALARTTASVPCHRVRRHARPRVRVDQHLHRHLPSKHWQFGEKNGATGPVFYCPNSQK